MLQMFFGMKTLHLDDSKCLTEICDVSGLTNLEEFSFKKCENLLTIHDSVGFLNKLKILNAEGCTKLESFPPIQLPSLQKLELSHCNRLKNFPEILGKMESLESIGLIGTSIEELPDSFQNLTRLNELLVQVEGHQMGHFKIMLQSSILMMPKLSQISLLGYHLLTDKSDKQGLMVSSKLKSLVLVNCNLIGESLPNILKWFANVTYLDLSKSNLTILPECIKENRSLRSLYLNYCKFLQEIRGIPPNLKFLSALNCESLSSSCTNMLLNQVLFFLVFNFIFHSVLYLSKLTSYL
jgi:Leucine-rich repeat (LRR) protein